MALLSRSRKEFRPITEAEAYARCHGDRGPDVGRLTVMPKPPRRFPVDVSGETLRRDFELRLGYRLGQQGRRDSNPRPTVLETAALPTELRP